MATADLKVTIDAEAAKLEREIQRASAAMLRFEGTIRRTGSSAEQLDRLLNQQKAQALNTLGRGMLTFGAATLAGLGLAAKAAIDWESAWTGVLKTVEGTPEQLAAVEAGLRGLATELPASHREIAAVAEAAGQLGIATDDVVGFTRVMIDLGETTNLTADEAATAIAQLMNVMGTAPADVNRLGAALVDLGNNGASTERDIILLAQRISGAGKQIGLSEDEVLAFGNALASVGIEAEAGGSAISRVMVNIQKAVKAGGEAVAGFAEVAGMSADQFSAAFAEDPAAAIDAFVVGLDRISASGGNVFAVLDELGLGEIRVRDALLRLAGAGDLLSESLDLGARAWEENTALVEEAAKRYDTSAAKIEIAKNSLVDLAIDVGSVLLPVIAGVAEGAADLAQFFGDLPGPVKAAATVLGLLAGAAATVGGGFLLLAPRLAAARELMLSLARTTPVLYGGLVTLGQTASIAAGIGIVVTALYALGKALEENIDLPVAKATEILLNLADGTDEAFAQVASALGRLHEFDGGLSRSTKQLEGFDQALAGLVTSGNADQAAESFDAMTAALVEQGFTADEVAQMLPQYADALKGVENESRLAAEATEPLNDSLVAIAERFGLTGEDVAAAAQDMLDSWSDAVSEFFNLNDALVEDQETTVAEFLAALEEQVAAQRDWEANMLSLAGRVPAAFLDELARMGPEGATQVALFAQMTDAELQKAVALWSESTGAGADAIATRLAEAGPVLAEIAQRHGAAVAQRVADGMAANGTTVFAEAKRQGVLIDQGVGTNRVRKAPIAVDVTGIGAAERALNNLARNRAAAIRVTVTTGVRVAGFTGQGGLTFQHGTEHAPGGVALVGEQGPELVEIPRGSRVHTASQTRAILSNPASFVGSGRMNAGQVINVHNEITPTQARSPLLFAALREVVRQENADMLREVAMMQRRGGRV